MSAYSYIQKRDTGYYYRQVVPLELINVVGKREIIRSLKTKDIKEAKRKCIQLAYEISNLFGDLRSNNNLCYDAQQLLSTELEEFVRKME